MPLCLSVPKPQNPPQEAPESRLWHFGNKYPFGVVDAILERFWKPGTFLKYFLLALSAFSETGIELARVHAHARVYQGGKHYS